MRMHKQFTLSKTALLLTLVSLVMAGTASAQDTGSADQTAGCQAQLSPDTLSVGASDLLQVSLSEWLGVVESVSADGESGIEVTQIEPGAPSTLTVEIDASNAVAGSWIVTLEGESGTCVGTLHIVDDVIEG